MYAARHAERRFKQGEYGQAAAVLAKHGVASSPVYFQLYRDIAGGVFSSAVRERTDEAEKALKDMMFRLVNVLQVRFQYEHQVSALQMKRGAQSEGAWGGAMTVSLDLWLIICP